MNVVRNVPLTGSFSEFPADRVRVWQRANTELALIAPGIDPTNVRPQSLEPARKPPGRTRRELAERSLPSYSVESYTRTIRPLIARMVTVARRILGDEVQAWDAVQEALISLWLEGEVPANPRAWLTRAVVLRSLHQTRCRSRRRRHERRACDQRPEASERDDPSRRMEYEDSRQTLNEVISTIPSESREVILLRTVAHMDYAEIADNLRIPVGTVRSRLNRTRQVLREALARRSVIDSGTGASNFSDC
jgi:RNA polymerase sigma-70 factor (ECF subfamily)